MNGPLIWTPIMSAINPAATRWPLDAGVAAVAGPLTSVAISSVTGTMEAHQPISVAASWVGGTAPFTVTLSGHSAVTGVTDNSIVLAGTATPGTGGYTVTVKDALNVTQVSAFYYAPTLYFSLGGAYYYFNTTTKVATFSASASGNPGPSITWYVSVNGGAYSAFATGSSFSTGAYDIGTAVSAYYIASNVYGSGTSNTVGGYYQ